MKIQDASQQAHWKVTGIDTIKITGPRSECCPI